MQSSTKNKTMKGNVGLLIGLAIGIGILIFVVAIMAAALTGLANTQTIATTNAVTNETHTGVLTNISRQFTGSTAVTSIVQVVNTSNGVVLASTGYTLVNATHWTLTNNVFNSTVAGNLSISYQYAGTAYSVAYNVTGAGVNSMKTFSDFFNVYVLAGILVGIVGLFSLIYSRKGGFS